jgi:hypothetical protein
MNFESLNNSSQIWVYQANRALTPFEKEFIHKELTIFTEEWESHGEMLNGAVTIVADYFVVLGVEPPSGKLCGGSVDALFRFIKSVGQNIQVDFFNRLKVLTINENNEPELISHSKLKEVPHRKMYDISINTKSQLESDFLISVENYLLAKAV